MNRHMTKIFCLIAALLVSAGCGKDRVDRVQIVNPEKKAESVVINLIPTINLPAGQMFMYIIPKNQAKELGYGDGSENLFVTKDTQGIIPCTSTVWKSGRTPHSWEAVLYINEN
jgi:hypothetical protein